VNGHDKLHALLGSIGEIDGISGNPIVKDAFDGMKNRIVEIVGIPGLSEERIYVAANEIDGMSLDLYRSGVVAAMPEEKRKAIGRLRRETKEAVRSVMESIGVFLH